MLELFGALTNVWLQSGVIAVCGMVTARGVRSRGATWSATVLRATWIGVALCAVLSMSSLASQVSQRALWNVSRPTTLDNSPSSVLASSAIIAPNAAAINETSSTRIDANRSETNALDLPMTPLETTVETTIAPNFQTQKLSILSVLLALWLSGSALLLMWFGVCALKMRRVIRTSTRIEDATWRDTLHALCEQMKVREPRLLQSERAQSPFLTGLFRPCIVLPRGDFGASQRFVLLHELTHLQRRDLWWSALARLVCALMWTQPALWILRRACERTSEDVCDEVIVSSGESPHQYAQCLLELAESWRPSRGERVVGLGVVPLRSSLARRVQNILQFSRRSSMTISRRASWAIGALMLGVVAASLSLVAVQTAAKPVTEPATSSTRVDLSTPEKTIQSFVRALNANDYDKAALCVEGGSPIVNEQLRVKNKAQNPFLRSVEIIKTQVQGTTAVVLARETMTSNEKKSYNTDEKNQLTVFLSLKNGAWKIVPRNDAKSNFASSETMGVAYFLSPPPTLKVALTKWAQNRGKASIFGRVVDDNGKPVAGATVYVGMENDDSRRVIGNSVSPPEIAFWNVAPRIGKLFFQQFETKADGTFRFTGLTSARYEISYNSRVPQQQVSSGNVLVTARETSSTRSPDLRLTSGALLSIRVLDNATRRGLSNVNLMWSQKREGRFIYVDRRMTNINGRLTARVPVGVTNVMLTFENKEQWNGMYVMSNGVPYTPVSKKGEVAGRRMYNMIRESKNVQVRANAKNEVVFLLQRYVPPKTATSSTRSLVQSANITGRVVYADGRPAAGVRVSLQPFDQVQISKRYEAWYEPQQKALLRLLSENGGSFRSPESQRKVLALWEKFGMMAKTGADGSYRLSGIENADHNILVDTSDEFIFNTQTAKTPDYVAAAASIHTNSPRTTEIVPNLVLTKGAIIQGRVLDRVSGKPLRDVYVYSHGPHRPRSGASVVSTRTNNDGRYQMRVAPGTNYVYISGGDQIKAMIHYGDNPPYVKLLDVFKAEQNFYASSDWASVKLDNIEWGFRKVGPSSNLFAVPTKQGQARTLDFRLNKLVTKRLANGLNAYIPAKPLY